MQAQIENALAELRLTTTLLDSARIRHLKAIVQLEELYIVKPKKTLLSDKQKASLLVKRCK